MSNHQITGLEKPTLRQELEHIILEEFHLLRLRLRFEEEALQDEGAAVTLADALRKALEYFLYDAESPGSPRRQVMEVHGLWPGKVAFAERLIEHKLREYMDAGELRLITRCESPGEGEPGFNPPDGCETVAAYWVFGLSLPGLPDRYFRAFVSRAGSQQCSNTAT